MEKPNRIFLHNPILPTYGNERTMAAVYARIIRILMDPAQGWNLEESNYLHSLRDVIKILLDSQPELKSEELEELKRLCCEAYPNFNLSIKQLKELHTAKEIVEPILQIPTENDNVADESIDVLMNQDKRSLAEQVMALQNQVKQLQAQSEMSNSNSTSDEDMFGFREHKGRTKNPNSDIDLRDENTRKRKNIPEKLLDDKGDVVGTTSSNSTLQDYILIIKAMYELRFFVNYDDTIENGKDLDRQKKAKLSKVMEAMGNAVNITELGKSYNSLLQKAKKPGEGYDLSVFDNLKEIAQKKIY